MFIRTLLIVVALTFTCLAFARADTHSDQQPAPHGGQVRTAGPYRFELVAGKNELTLYVADQSGNPIPSAGGTAKAIVMTGKKRWVLILSSVGDNKLGGAGEFTLGKSSPVTVIVKLPENDSQLVHFKLSKKAKAKAHKR
ncbi:MAG TPA: hypothetical protein VEV20_05125 [Burkholderiales bacterium]|nr:hypothetical protein [Burkholderiales bacterium]